MTKQYKFPTILGLIILAVGIAVGIFLVQNRQIFQPQASPEETPQMVKITNTGDRSFTVSWITDKKTTGFIAFGKTDSLGNTVKQSSVLGETSNVHYVQVENLSPATAYFFKIGSGKNLFDNGGQAYTVTTGPTLEALPTPDVIFGKVESLTEPAILYVTIAGVTPLSTLVENNGTWSVPLSTARSRNLDSYAKYDKKESMVEIIVLAPSAAGQAATGLTTAKVKTGSSHPVPVITLGKTHDFTNIKPVGEDTPSLPLSQLSLPQGQEEQQSGFSNLTPDEASETPQLAQGQSPEATSSPAPKVKPSPSPSPSPSPKASPSPNPSPSPTATPSGRVSLPSTESGVPTSGNLTPMLGAIIMGVILVLTGIFLPKIRIFN